MIVGAGPIGLAAVMTAKLYSPGRIIVIDPAEPRRDAAKRIGADVVLDAPTDEPRSRSCAASPAASGRTSSWRRSASPRPSSCAPTLVRPGGRVANIGVHGAPATLHLETLWIKNVTITTGLVDT